MKKLSKVFIGMAVLTAMMICMTAVSFAGTAEDKVKVNMRVADQTSFAAIYDNLEVKGDLVETNFPDFAKYEPEGVSWLDAAVAVVIKKTGSAEQISLGDGGDYAYVSSALGKQMLGSFNNNEAINSVHSNIKDGQNLVMQVYDGNDWNMVCSYFDKAVYNVTSGKKFTANLNGVAAMAGGIGALKAGKIMQVNAKDGTMKALSGATVKDGKATMSFAKSGVYYISAQGDVTYESWGSEVTSKYYGAYAKVVVKDATPAKPVIKKVKRNSKKKATVVWKKAKNAKKYQVQYRMKGKKKWTTKTTAKTKLVIKKLKAKKAYQVRVRAINGSAKSAYSKVKTIKKK